MRRCTIMLLLALLLTACATPAPRRAAAPPSAAPAGAEVETIHLMSVPRHPLDRLLDPLIAEFQQQYPQYRVEKVPVGKSDGTAEEAELLGPMREGALDLVEVTWWSDALTKATLPLDGYIQKDNFDLKPFGSNLAQHVVDGRHYYLPVVVLPAGLLVNADLAAAAGVTLPVAGWTWDEFRAVAQKVAHDDGGKRIYALPDTPAEELVRYYLEGMSDHRSWEASDAQLKESLAYVRALISLDRTVQPPVVRSFDHGMAVGVGDPTLWLAGQSVFVLGPYLEGYTDSLKPGFKVGFVPLPAYPGRPPAAPATLYSLAISAGSKHPDAAWAFLSFVAGRQGAVLLAKSGTLPLFAGDGVREAWFSRQPAPPAATETFWNTHWLMLNEDMRMGHPVTQLFLLANRTLAQSMAVDEALVLYHKELDAKLGKK